MSILLQLLLSISISTAVKSANLILVAVLDPTNDLLHRRPRCLLLPARNLRPRHPLRAQAIARSLRLDALLLRRRGPPPPSNQAHPVLQTAPPNPLHATDRYYHGSVSSPPLRHYIQSLHAVPIHLWRQIRLHHTAGRIHVSRAWVRLLDCCMVRASVLIRYLTPICV